MVRRLAESEVVEALELPSFDDASGLVRVRLRGVEDDVVGYATLLKPQGQVFLEALPPEKL